MLKENSLSLLLLGLFFTSFLGGQIASGWLEYNQEQQQKNEPTVLLPQYLGTGHFWEATMENWESEFLQMFTFLILTAYFFQKGSAESKKLDESEAVDEDPREHQDSPDAPWPVRRGGFVLTLYEHSLSLTFFILFVAAALIHAAGGVQEYNDEQRHEGGQTITYWQYFGTSRFWFESFQNWQSEFFTLGLMVILTIWLRERGSPQSKPVAAPHSQTGKE
jgi:hypothetical protein